jgi:hypothetical protein
VRGEQSLVFEPLQRGVHGSDGVVTSGAFGEIVANGQAIGFLTLTSDGEQCGEFQ